MIIRPQAGPQETFLSSSADVAIVGGAAGGGKTHALLLEPLRHVMTNPRFAAAFFRRNTTQIKNPGGLWDQSMRLYPYTGGVPSHTLEWRWKNGGRVKFGHLEHEVNKLDYHGSELPLLLFDELTTFTETQFWYLFSRNRSMSGVPGYIRASCNPDADSWVAKLIEWWIDQETGLAIDARSGVIRWFVRVEDRLEWGDGFAEMKQRFPTSIPKSLTFVPARLDDNPALDLGDPNYRANLMNMQLVDRERLLGGNWKIRPASGMYFQRSWCPVVDILPAHMTIKRGWDLASTAFTGSNDPDWTCGVKLGRSYDGKVFVLDVRWFRGSPGQVKQMVINTASQDGAKVPIHIPQDPGQGGKFQIADYVSDLAGYVIRSQVESGDKITRFSPFSAQCEHGNVSVVRADWNDRWFSELEAFPQSRHDDAVDATSTAFASLTKYTVSTGAGMVLSESREQDGWSVPG